MAGVFGLGISSSWQRTTLHHDSRRNGLVMSAIRLLTPEDAERYWEHRRRALRDEPLAFAASPEDDVASSVDAVRDLLSRTPASAVFGAFSDTLVGSIGIYRDRHLKAEHKAHVWGMYVEPRSRRRGLGRALLEAAVEHARALRGVSLVHLSVTETARAAKRLYREFGFWVWGTEPDSLRYDGESASMDHMVLLLDAGATAEGSP